MHDLKLLRDGMDTLRAGMARRGALAEFGPQLDRLATLEAERRDAITRVEAEQARRNQVTQEVAQKRRAGEDATALIEQGRGIGEAIAGLDARRAEVEREMHDLLMGIPNLVLDEVQEGGEDAAVVVREWGTPRAAESVAPHWETAERFGILDLARGAKVTGSGFVVYRGLGARLVRGMLQMMIDLHADTHGYEELWVPHLVNRDTMTGTGQLPKFEEDMYALRDDPYFLIPTAEVPVTNLYRDEILDAEELPRSFVAFTPCFRREAGSAGKDTRGLLRVHQFDKVELVRYTTPETSREELEVLTGHAEAVLQSLGLPYRVIRLAAGDTGFSSAMTYDLEVFAPGVGKWLEVSSCSVFTDFQARRANIRYRPGPKEKPRFVHTLNGSALAFSRVIAALLEHHLQDDGSVSLPEVLRPYVGRDSLG